MTHHLLKVLLQVDRNQELIDFFLATCFFSCTPLCSRVPPLLYHSCALHMGYGHPTVHAKEVVKERPGLPQMMIAFLDQCVVTQLCSCMRL